MNSYTVGAKVKLLLDDMDNDENGLERKIPAGSLGTITDIEECARHTYHCHVIFDRGGWLIFYADEMPQHVEII